MTLPTGTLRPFVAVLLALTALVAAPLGVRAQAVLLDEGTFEIFVGDRKVGSETFSIHRVGLGGDSEILATGTVEVDGSGVRTVLKTRPDYTPLSYQASASGTNPAEVSIVLGDARYQSRIRSPEGELQREYRAAPGTVLVEDGVAHHHFFVARALTGGRTSVTAMVPLASRQVRVTAGADAPETFRLGRDQVPARHLRLDVDGEVRELWVDDEGRVLRVAIPARDWRAERTVGG